MKAIRWAICGLGRIAGEFLAAARAVPHCTVAGCISSDPARAEAFRAAHGLEFAAGYGDGETVRDKIDAVYIASNMHLHHPNTLAFLAAGIPCLVEKSFALNFTQAEEMVAFAKRKHTLMMEAMWTLFLPSAKAVHALILSGKLGRIVSMRGDFCCDMTGNPESRVFKKALGGGSILDLMTYPVAYAQRLAGAPKRVEASKQMQDGVDLSCTAHVLYPGDIPATFNSSIAAKTPREHFTVVCEGGVIDIPHFYRAEQFTVITNDGQAVTHQFDPAPGFTYEIEHFNDLIRTGKPESPLLPLSDTLTAMATLTAMLGE